MTKALGRWFKVYEDEISLFLWATLLLFLIRNANILFNNFAETAFLKRYGVEYLPIVYMVNSITTFIIMGFMTGIMARVSGTRLMMHMLFVFGGSIAFLRFVIPLGIDLLYPLLFILKAQYEVLLALLFWNLANDLFNTRQSKRLFPLITAGGVLGGVVGSFATPFLAGLISMDNLMIVYLVISVLGALAVRRMGVLFPTLLISTKRADKKTRFSSLEELKKVVPLIRESKLIKILIVITLMPNVVIPIMNYQFNFAIDQTFASEGGMIIFFGYFRGVLNIISLIILLFVGRIYGRFGLPLALMFHPFNYIIAFMAFLLRFDVFSAMYARISTNVLRTTINNPARAILMGVFPKSYRAVIFPFLRGTVVRVGILAGSGFIIVSEGFIHPRYLSLVAVVFVTAWMIATISLKRGYAGVVSELISKNMLDLKSIEKEDIAPVFNDRQTRLQLVEELRNSQGEDTLWYAGLLKSLKFKDLDSRILPLLQKQDVKTRAALIGMISDKAGEETFEVLKEFTDFNNPEIMAAIIKTANRVSPENSPAFNRQVFEKSASPEVRAYALTALYRSRPDDFRQVIESWLESQKEDERTGGIIAAGGSGDASFTPRLEELLKAGPENREVLIRLFESLKLLGSENLNDLALGYLKHPSEPIRKAALNSFEITNKNDLSIGIEMLGDNSRAIRNLAKEKIQDAPFQDPQILVESLIIPRKIVRDGIYDILLSLNIKDLDIFRFARMQVEKSYNCLAEQEALRRLPGDSKTRMLIEHIGQRKSLYIDNVLRCLAAKDKSGKMRIIWRGITSSNSRIRSNGLEALDDLIDSSLSRIMMPLLEDQPAAGSLETGRKYFKIPGFAPGGDAIFSHLLKTEDWVTLLITLSIIQEKGPGKIDWEIINNLSDNKNTHVRFLAENLIAGHGNDPLDRGIPMENQTSIPDKVLYLKRIDIFQGLSVNELAAVASVTEDIVYPKEETVIREGEQGEDMYLVIEGEVAVLKDWGEKETLELDHITAGDYFGEMALIENTVRSATIRTLSECRFLFLHKREFEEIVKEYPQIALHICRVLSARLRKSHEKLKRYEMR